MTKIKIKSKKRDAAGITHLVIPKPEGYLYALGQYAYLKVSENQTKTLAYASHPVEPHILFLFRGDFTHDIPATLSPPQGDGFRCAFDDPQRMLFIAHGTGITALRAAMIERKRLGFTRDTLLYGAPHRAQEAELDCLNENFGVKQLRAYSQSNEKSHVQDVLQTLDLKEFGSVLLAGSSGMLHACRQILHDMEYPADRIFTNY